MPACTRAATLTVGSDGGDSRPFTQWLSSHGSRGTRSPAGAGRRPSGCGEERQGRQAARVDLRRRQDAHAHHAPPPDDRSRAPPATGRGRRVLSGHRKNPTEGARRGLCFDKLDVEKAMEVRGPDGQVRQLKQPRAFWRMSSLGTRASRSSTLTARPRSGDCSGRELK